MSIKWHQTKCIRSVYSSSYGFASSPSWSRSEYCLESSETAWTWNIFSKNEWHAATHIPCFDFICELVASSNDYKSNLLDKKIKHTHCFCFVIFGWCFVNLSWNLKKGLFYIPLFKREKKKEQEQKKGTFSLPFNVFGCKNKHEQFCYRVP